MASFQALRGPAGPQKGFCCVFRCCAAGCIASVRHLRAEGALQRRAMGRPAGSRDRKQGYGHARILPFPLRLQYARKSEVPVISRAGSGDILVLCGGSVLSHAAGKGHGGFYRRPAGRRNAAQMERRGHWPDAGPEWRARSGKKAVGTPVPYPERRVRDRYLQTRVGKAEAGARVRRPCCGQGAAENAR